MIALVDHVLQKLLNQSWEAHQVWLRLAHSKFRLNLSETWNSFETVYLCIFQGVLMYFPHEAGHETLPRSTDLEDDAQEPIFECFWQGRLAPLSYVHK